MSAPCDAGGLEVSVVWPLEFVSGVELVELPMLPLDEPLTVPLPVCEESTGPIAPGELAVESELVEGAAGRTRSLPVASLPVVEPAESPLDEVEEVLLSGVVVLELDEV